MIWTLLHIIDICLWLIIAGSVAYVVLFAVAGLFRRREDGLNGTNRQDGLIGNDGKNSGSRFLVLFPAYREDRVIVRSVEAFLQQDYNQEQYQVAVISDHMQAETNEQLAALPITLLQPQFEKSSKAKALQYAIGQADSGLIPIGGNGKAGDDFTHVVILDADNVVASDFLSRLNVFCQQGYQAIQCHRTAKNSDNDIAMLDGVSEEINNSIFRRAHNNIGLSSALIGSGMCFSYAWFRDNVSQLDTAVEDRELEALLTRQHIYVKYVEDLFVMDEKVSTQDNFQRQRLRWMTGQIQALLQMLPYLPKAVMTGNVNYIDKTIQQMLIPRSILLVLVPLISLLMTVLAPVWSIKWWVLSVCFCIALLLAIPAQLRTRAVFGRLLMLPQLVWRMVTNIARIDKNNREFIHTTHDK